MMACCEAFNRERLTTRLLASLARRFSWVDREELSQSIFLAVAEISDSYPNRSEDERGAIAYKAAFRLVSREALKASSPVSETWHNLQNLKRVKTAPADEESLASNYALPDEIAERRQIASIVRAAAHRCALEIPLGQLATRVVFNEETPRALSDETGINRKAIYRAVDELKRKLKPILEERLNDYSFCC